VQWFQQHDDADYLMIAKLYFGPIYFPSFQKVKNAIGVSKNVKFNADFKPDEKVAEMFTKTLLVKKSEENMQVYSLFFWSSMFLP
jgi:hypothetical protein